MVKKRAGQIGMPIQLKQLDEKQNIKRSIGEKNENAPTTIDVQGEDRGSVHESTTRVTKNNPEENISSADTITGQKQQISQKNMMPENIQSRNAPMAASIHDVLGPKKQTDKQTTQDECCLLKGRNARSPNENQSGSSTPIVGSKQNAENGKQEPTVGQRPPVPHRRAHLPHTPRARRPNTQHHHVPNHQTPQIHHPRRIRPHHPQVVASIRERIAGLKTAGGTSGGSKDLGVESRIGKPSEGSSGLSKLRQRESRRQSARRNNKTSGGDEPKQDESVLGSRQNVAAEETSGHRNPQIITQSPDLVD